MEENAYEKEDEGEEENDLSQTDVESEDTSPVSHMDYR